MVEFTGKSSRAMLFLEEKRARRFWEKDDVDGRDISIVTGARRNRCNNALYCRMKVAVLRQNWPATAHQPNSITTLRALNVRDGAPRWQYQMRNGGVTGAILESNSLYFEISQVKTAGGKQDLQVNVVALNAQTGDVRWSTPVKLLDGTEKTPTPVPISPDPGFSSGFSVDMAPVASKDAVYYSTPGNRIYALQSSGGKILEQFWVDKTNQTTVRDRVVLFVVP